MRAIIFIVIYFLCLFSITFADELNNSFTYRGEPIHPALVKEFSNWMSDNRPPIITTVDVSAAFNTNQYHLSEIKKRNDWYFYEEIETDGDIRFYESFGYRWLGKMDNGIHVLETASSGGGSGVFMDLMLVKFSEGEILWEGKKEKQLLMSIVGTYMLGDRYEGDIKVYPDRIFIPASKRQSGGRAIEEDVELTF